MSLHRLLSLYQYARPEEVESGLYWYDSVGLTVRELASSYDVKLTVAAGVIAVLSPNVSWETNLTDSRTVLSTLTLGGHPEEITVSTYNSNKDKAISIVMTGNVFPYLSGPKVETFFHNLLGDYSEPCIDSHAINAWFGKRVEGSNISLRNRTTTIRKIRADYIRAANTKGLTPAQFQATIWVMHQRRIAEGRIIGYERKGGIEHV